MGSHATMVILVALLICASFAPIKIALGDTHTDAGGARGAADNLGQKLHNKADQIVEELETVLPRTGTGSPSLQDNMKGTLDSAADSVGQHQREAAGAVGDFQGRSANAYAAAKDKARKAL